MIKTDNFDKVEITAQSQLRDWLLENHNQKDSVWLVTYKKAAGDKYVDRFAVLDELLCFGWIDGIRRVLDDTRTMQLIAPRQQQAWSGSYKDRAAKLIETGQMHAAGLKEIERAKACGLWNFFNDVDAFIVPDDLADALAARPLARAHWDNFSPSSRRNMLRLIKIAKTPATRTKRIAQTADLAARNEKVPQT